MKIKSGFVVREIAGQSVVIALGDAGKIFNGLIKLNETGRMIWDMLTVGAEFDAIVDRLCEEYEVERSVLAADCDKFIKLLQENNILE